MIDAHNHLQDPRFLGRQDEMISTMKDKGVTGCIVNGTHEDDWPEVARLADRHPGFVIPAFGLHPWKVAGRSSHWLETLDSFLQEHPQAILGECGLDRWIKNPDLGAQHEAFRQQIQLALDHHRPITIHCLKAWGALLEDLNSFPKLPAFLLHSFAGSIETARQLEKLGGYFSFSGSFLHPRKKAVRETFAQIDPDRILVETDAPDMMPPEPCLDFESFNHPANLGLIADGLAKICALPVKTFEKNTRRYLGQKP